MTAPHEKNADYSIELEVEVPGTPEQVWDAIATGSGIAAWFVPAEVAAHEGGRISLDMGGGMEAAGVVTAWEPPRRMTYEEIWEPSDPASKSRLATEFLVEARSGSSCVVRLVTNVFGSTADWGDELESMREGWTVFLHNLQLYMTDFAGEECSTVMATGQAAGSLADAWSTFAAALHIDAQPTRGDVVSANGPGPRFAGTVDSFVDADHHRGVVLKTESPAPGVLVAFVYHWRGESHPYLHAYLFGDSRQQAADQVQRQWKAWLAEHFPMPEPADATSAS